MFLHHIPVCFHFTSQLLHQFMIIVLTRSKSWNRIPEYVISTVKPVFATTWERGTTWELRTAIPVPRPIQYTEMYLRNRTTLELRTVFRSPLGVPNSQVSLYWRLLPSLNYPLAHLQQIATKSTAWGWWERINSLRHTWLNHNCMWNETCKNYTRFSVHHHNAPSPPKKKNKKKLILSLCILCWHSSHQLFWGTSSKKTPQLVMLVE